MSELELEKGCVEEEEEGDSGLYDDILGGGTEDQPVVTSVQDDSQDGLYDDIFCTGAGSVEPEKQAPVPEGKVQKLDTELELVKSLNTELQVKGQVGLV